LSSMATELRNCSRNLPILLGFSVLRPFIREGASSGGNQDGHTMGGHSQGLGRTPLLCGQPLAPPSGYRSVFGILPGKIRLLGLVSSNSENISCVAFLKQKNSRKQGTGTVASCQ
jgi:hypothetical protein